MHGLNPEIPVQPMLTERPAFGVGDLLIHPAIRRIDGPAGFVQLEPRVMQVLLALADAEGRVQSREALERLCWRGLFVSEDSLTRAIGAVRRALRQAGSACVQLETIPKTGYRLLAEAADGVATEIGAEGSAGGWRVEDADPAAAVAAPVARRRLLAGLGVAGLAAAGVAGWLSLRDDPAARQVASLKSAGRDSWRLGLPEAEAQGMGFLEEAVRLAPRDAEGWGLLALLTRNASEMAEPVQAGGLLARAEAAWKQGLALNPQQGDALAARALSLPMFGDWLASEARLRDVLTAAPKTMAAEDALGLLRISTGQVLASLETATKLAARDPLAATLQHKLAYRLWSAGRLAEADRLADRALALWPLHPAIWFARMWIYGYSGRGGEALRMIADAPARPPLPPQATDLLSATIRAGESRRPAEVAAAIRLNRAAAPKSPGTAVWAVQHLAWLGDLDGAFEAARGYLARRGAAVGRLRPDPAAAPALNEQHRRKTMMLFIPPTAAMRADPRFPALADEIGLSAFWEKSGNGPDFLSR